MHSYNTATFIEAGAGQAKSASVNPPKSTGEKQKLVINNNNKFYAHIFFSRIISGDHQVSLLPKAPSNVVFPKGII